MLLATLLERSGYKVLASYGTTASSYALAI